MLAFLQDQCELGQQAAADSAAVAVAGKFRYYRLATDQDSLLDRLVAVVSEDLVDRLMLLASACRCRPSDFRYYRLGFRVAVSVLTPVSLRSPRLTLKLKDRKHHWLSLMTMLWTKRWTMPVKVSA